MIKNRVLFITCIVVALILVAGINGGKAAFPSAANGGGSPADYPWLLQTVESPSGGEVGQYASLAFHPANATPYISYYNATNQELYLSFPTDTGGNCGPGNTWTCEVIDSDGDVGQYSSIDIYYNSSSYNRKIGIAYHDDTNGALKIAIWSCPIIGLCGWTISTVEATVALPLFQSGYDSALKFDSNGVPHISYYTWSSNLVDTTYSLKYAHYVGSGGNCGEDAAAGQWQCDAIDSYLEEEPYASLDLTSDNHPVIAYHLPATTYDPSQIRLCSWQSTWDCITIDDNGGTFPSLAIDNNDHAQIAYYKAYDDTLMYAKYVGSGGNCGLNSYQCDTIANIGSISPSAISLSTYMTSPIIAYQNNSDPQGYPTLDIARPISAYTGKIAGNCGPTVGIIPQWQCDTIDYGGYLYEADYVSTAIDITGLAAIGYYEYDDYYGEGRLKYAYQLREYEIFLPLAIK